MSIPASDSPKSAALRSLLPALMALGLAMQAADSRAQPVHGLAMHGEPKYGPDFSHFDYSNPQAPKGGAVRLWALGTFDTLNPYTLKGVAAVGLGNVFQTLTVGSDDEAFSQYGELAESIEVANDNSWVGFVLNPAARWHDGRSITADDVVFTFDTLKKEGHPFYRAYYGSVERAEKRDTLEVRFHFANSDNSELALIIGQMPVLAKHYWQGRDFAATTLEPPLGSGPYRIAAVDAGRSITYERVPDWWAQDLAVNRGRHNFDMLRYDYYRDSGVSLEAFKAGEYDLRVENNSKLWATAYEGPPFEKGLIVKRLIAHERPTGMQAFVFNTRRELFADPRVREALGYAFDFEWTNKNLFYGQYTRTRSYFSNSELASSGLPSQAELAILERFRDRIPDRVFTTEYRPPSTDDKGGIRSNLRRALALLEQAGWAVRDRKLTHLATGSSMSFEILLVQPAFERVVLPFSKNLERLGIEAKVRTVDPAQYQKRVDAFDFDIVVGSFGQSLSPGNEQRDFWSSANASVEGSRNIIGVRDPVVDELIELIIAAPDRASLITRTRALDRVLLWSFYVIPNWHIRAFRVAYWDRFGHPAENPRYAFGFDTWWIDRTKDARIGSARR